ncbi:ABC transporter substrate-binding protein [uncultured Microbacterium sp.]|uniref:ABC transporter substrate-binding protein n=1 Tax=uncultured Microbacterium sp. TaxID=191216 RepID=UPI002626A72B|nr:ABC transporter substrate-binding protein [uncultured Microbacterium sp.]
MNAAKKRAALIAAVGIGALSLTSCAGAAVNMGGSDGGAVEEIVIGALHPLSGASAVDGQQMSHAAQMAVDEINAAGGIACLDGAELVLEATDTKGEPETGQSEATRLIQEGATALVGSYQSATSANIAAVAERNGIPFVMDVSALDSILEQGYTYSFRTQPSGGMMGERAAQFLKEIADESGTDVSTIGFLYEQGNYGASVYDAFSAEAEKLGMTVTNAISYDPASSDLSTQVQQAVAGGADVLAVTGYYRDGLLISQAIDSIGPDVQAVYGVANGGYDQEQFITDAPNGGEGYLNANYSIDVTNDRAQKVTADFETEFGEPMRTSAALTYDGVAMIAEAIETACSADPDAIRDAIADTKYVPIVVNDGPVKFDKTGQNENATVSVVQVQDGQLNTVFPNELAEADFVFPAPVK